MGFPRWLWLSGEGWALRISLGLSVFAALAIWDLARKGRQATRWKEYAFLFAATAAAMAYGLANDMITVTISPLYFIEHERLPLDTPNVRGIAAVVAMKATWSLGLVLGAVLLIANNPMRGRAQLPYRKLYLKLLCPFIAAGTMAFVFGAAAWSGWFDAWLEIEGAMRPVECVYYVHTGAYPGGFLGGIAAVASVVLERRGERVRATA